MQNSSFSPQFSVIWGASAGTDTITYPIPSTTSTSGRAALGTGFTSTNMTPLEAGGIPPFGQDFNGILKMLSVTAQNYEAGNVPVWSSDFATALNGYPKYALVQYGGLFYVSTVDGNGTTPGATDASWQSLFDGYQPAGDYLVTNSTATQTVTGPVTFSGATLVPAVSDWTTYQAVGAKDADARYATITALDAETSRAEAAEQSANENADGRVSKTGDTMTGALNVSTHSGSDASGQLRWGGYLSGQIAGYTYNSYNLYSCEIVGQDPYVDLQVNFSGTNAVGASGRTDFTFHGISGRIGTILGNCAVMSDLPLPSGMHVQTFIVSIPAGTTCGIDQSPYVASLPSAFSTFSYAHGGDTGPHCYTVACSPSGNAAVNINVQTPDNKISVSNVGAAVLFITAYGYY